LDALLEAGLEPRHMLVWCKSQAVFSMNRTDYDYQHELIWYGWKEKHHFYGQGKYKTTLWNYNKPNKSDLHPTMKPPELIEEAIKNSMEPVEKRACGIANNTGKGGIVLDPFAGSGSTMAACERLKRRAYMMEISPRYCDVIIRRGLELNPRLAAFRLREGKRERMELKDFGGEG
jgi:DNA modification methylase